MDQYRKPREWTIEHYETVAVTALPPGWRNVFEVDGQHSEIPCPAVLLQELRRTDHWHERPTPTRLVPEMAHATVHEAPWETRVTFACVSDGGLDPVTDISNYVTTLPPGTSEG